MAKWRSEQSDQVIRSHLHGIEDLRQQPAPDVLSCVDRYDCLAAIRVTEKIVASARTDRFKACAVQRAEQIAAPDGGKSSHTSTVIC